MQALERALGAADRRWTLPTPLPAPRAQARIDNRAEPATGGWTPLRRHADRAGRTYFTAGTVDPIASLVPFDERFYLEIGHQRVTVLGRVSPLLRGVLAVGLALSALVLLASLASYARTGSEDALAGILVGLLALVGVRSLLPRLLRSGDHARLRRWLDSILRDPDEPDD